MSRVQKLTNGEPRRYTIMGCYTIYYVVEHSVLCPDCASEEEKGGSEDIFPSVNWEDESLHCEDCGLHLEPSYPKE